MNLMNFFKLKPNKNLIKILDESSLLLKRLNKDEDINIPRVISLLKKDYSSFNDKLYSVVESMLLVTKKVAEYKELDYEMEPWFIERVNSATAHTFLMLNYLDPEDDQLMESFIREFYAVKELLPAPKKCIFDHTSTDRIQLLVS